jgi:RNA polymerase sigma-70 factor (sigma-E family)
MVPGEDFAAFVAGYGRRLVHLAELLTGDAHLAEDLTQDVLARTYVRWDRINGSDPYAYVRRALVNARTDSWRRRLPIPVDRVAENHSVPDPAEGLADRDALLRALAELTTRERSVIVLRFYEDLSEEQIARVLGVAIGTVKSTAARALRKLRAHPCLAPIPIEEIR